MPAICQAHFITINLITLFARPIYLSIYLSVCLSVYLSVCLSVYGCTVVFFNLGRFFSFLILYTVGRTPWTAVQPIARPLRTRRTTQTQNNSTQISMPQVGFEPTIPVFERAKTVHALERAATVIGICSTYMPYICIMQTMKSDPYALPQTEEQFCFFFDFRSPFGASLAS
jgi:hypothetical protein